MNTVYMIRQQSSDYGTEGWLFVPHLGYFCYTMEPPWRDNRRSLSCIPPGEYIVNIRNSPKYGEIYHVTNVKDRSYILIHSGNVAGDATKGYKTHSQGCILLGQKRGWLWKQKAILNSKATVTSFMIMMKKEPFKLHII